MFPIRMMLAEILIGGMGNWTKLITKITWKNKPEGEARIF